MNQKGFTLIELLIVIAVLSILLAVIVPQVGSFLTSSKIAAANTEVANVKTAVMSFLADNGEIPHTDGGIDDSDLLVEFLSELPKYGLYEFNPNTGQIVEATALGNYTDIMQFDSIAQQWAKK